MQIQCFPLLFLLLSYLIVLASAQNCTKDTFNNTHIATNNLKVSSTYKFKLGVVGAYGVNDMEALLAICHELNNDMTLNPNVEIQIYNSTTKTQSDVLLASMYHIRDLGIQGIISGFSSTESRTAQLVAKIYNVPQISGNALSFALTDKNEYPFFLRTNPPDLFQIDGIVELFEHMNWTRGLVIYTMEDYGNGYSRLVNAAQLRNISFDAVGISSTATAAVVNSTVDSIVALVEKMDYRIFVFYTQGAGGNGVQRGMIGKGLFGPEYVYILTATMTPFFVTNSSLSVNNNGAIGIYLGVPEGPVYNSLYNSWSTSLTNPFRVQLKGKVSASAWYNIDALLAYAHAVHSLMEDGVPFSTINTNVLFNALKNNTFLGSTGDVVFDKNGDRLGNFDMYAMTPNGTAKVGTYSALTKTLAQTGDFIFYGGSYDIPRDGPYVCSICEHGTCVEDVGCVCDSGYSGTGCTAKEENYMWTIGLAVGIVVLFLIGGGGGYAIYRRKRSELVKQVTDKQRSNIARTDLNMGNRIGRGASGEVFKATFRGTEVAVKKIVTSNVDNKVIEEFELEVAIMCGLRHPNIILFMGSCFDPASKEMLLVMEFMQRGSLHDVLHNPKIDLNYDMRIHLACQAAQGMNFLHMSTPPIIHSDLKSHNILLDDKWNARISDFGITKFKGSTKKESSEQSIGTIFWTSPETLAGVDHTEKSDCYSFGIVLWEIFHRKDPYIGRDPVSVAIDVIRNNLRPAMDPDTPTEMKDLICSCWHQEADKRPSFQEIMTTLRSLSLKNPMYSAASSGAMRVDAPTGLVYLVNTSVVGGFTLWDATPKATLLAMKLLNGLIRANMEMYRGYEATRDTHSFLIAFATAEEAINFCVATQVSLLHVNWPHEVLVNSSCELVTGSDGQILWKGPRVRMSVFSGVPNCELDSSTGRIVYIGPVVEKCQKVLKGIRGGMVLVTDEVLAEVNKKGVRFVQNVKTEKCGEMNVSARGEATSIHEVIIEGLEGRKKKSFGSSSTGSTSPDGAHPHTLVDVEEEIPMIESQRGGIPLTRVNSVLVDWVAQSKDIDMKEAIGKGSTGDCSRAYWKGKEVAVKILVNQKLKEDDMFKLTADAAYMSKLTHSNILSFHAVCLDAGSIAIISEYMTRGNLKAILADSSISLSLAKRMKIAYDIAQGMAFLTGLDDEDVRKHDNLKSNNILIGREWEAKVADYGQSNIRELARTMTSVGSVAWTAPEILNGEDLTPRCAVYSFGIITWELMTRQIPYNNEHPIRVVSKILAGYRPSIPVDCPAAIKQMIERCWSEVPDDRPTWDSIMQTLSSTLRTLGN